MKKQLLIYLCGPHTSGKTTILKYLQNNHLVEYTGEEIGKSLYYSRSFSPEKQDDGFESEVTRLELERDRFIHHNGFQTAVVESWHTGNLAYAMVRNPHSIEKVVESIQASPLLHRSYGIWLRTSKENIYNRTKTFSSAREWASEFYTSIDAKMESCFEMLNLTNYCTIDANREVDAVMTDVLCTIKSLESI